MVAPSQRTELSPLTTLASQTLPLTAPKEQTLGVFMRIQYKILLLTFLAMSTGNIANAQRLTKEAAPLKKKAALRVPKGLWLSMSAATYTAAALDMHATADAEERFRKYPNVNWGTTETDPLARPFVRLPRPAYYATGFALATGINWLGYRMFQSRKLGKVWWLPQSISITANSWGYQTRRLK